VKVQALLCIIVSKLGRPSSINKAVAACGPSYANMHSCTAVWWQLTGTRSKTEKREFAQAPAEPMSF